MASSRQVEFLISGSRLDTGAVNVLGRVYFFEPSTTNNRAVHSDKAQTAYTMSTAPADDPYHPNKYYVLLDAAGKPGNGEVYAYGTYDIYIYDADNVLIETISDATFDVVTPETVVTETITADAQIIDSATRLVILNPVGAIGVSLPTAADLGAGNELVLVNISVNTVTVNRQGADTINGATSWSLDQQYEPLRITTDGSTSFFAVGAGSIKINHGHLSSTDGSVLAVGPGVMNVGANFSNLIFKYVTVATVDIDADSAIVYNSSGKSIGVGAINLTLNITLSQQVLGRDTADAEAASTWYHAWVAFKADGTTYTGFLSQSADRATVQTNIDAIDATYVFLVYVGAIYNNATPDFVDIYQVGNEVLLNTNNKILTSGSSTVYATMATELAIAIPTTAKRVRGWLDINDDSNSNSLVFLAVHSDGFGVKEYGQTSGNATTSWWRGGWDMSIKTAQTLWYKVAEGTDDVDIYVTEWKY